MAVFIQLLLVWSPPSHAFINSRYSTIKNLQRKKMTTTTRHRQSSSPSSPTTTFPWAAEWYPVIPVQDLTVEGPNRVTLLGKDFCLWYDDKEWRAFADVCPHRLVPLSEGRIESSNEGKKLLQCAYHGWEFDGRGNCARVPQSSTPVTSQRACATSFPVQVAQGLVWIFPTSNVALAQTKTLPLIPELDDPEMIDGTNFFVRDMPYSWDVLVENLCDPAHVNFAHHSFMRGANRDSDDKVLNLKITNTFLGGFAAAKDPPPPNGGQYDFTFTAPCLLYARISNSAALSNKKNSNQGVKLKRGNFIGLGQYCIPTAPGQCRLIARFPLRIPVKPVMWIMRRTPRWVTHFDQNIVMDSDVVFLCRQDEILDEQSNGRNQANYYLPAGSDAMVTAFRKWLGSYGGGQPQWLGIPAKRSVGEPVVWLRPQSIPAREGRDALLDRYRQHTDVCSSCRQAHRNLVVLREGLVTAGIVLLAATAASTSSRPQVKLALGILSAVSLLLPKVLLKPIIGRMQCAPWPRKKWMEPKKI